MNSELRFALIVKTEQTPAGKTEHVFCAEIVMDITTRI